MRKEYLYLPKTHNYIPLFEPVIYLAGPIRGAGDWQKKAVQMIFDTFPKYYKNIHVVCPCRWDSNHEMAKHKVSDERDLVVQGFSRVTFENQTLWERHYMDMAGGRGSILFWLPTEDKDNPREKKGGPYAQDTYGELGEWRGRLMMSDRKTQSPLIIGAEEEFPGLRTIQRNFKNALGSKISFKETLEDAVQSAIEVSIQKMTDV